MTCIRISYTNHTHCTTHIVRSDDDNDDDVAM